MILPILIIVGLVIYLVGEEEEYQHLTFQDNMIHYSHQPNEGATYGPYSESVSDC